MGCSPNWAQEDTAVQRAKRALKAQLKLRGEAAGRAQALRAARDEEGDAAADASAGEVVGVGDESDDGARKAELQDLEERVATASKVGLFFLFFFFQFCCPQFPQFRGVVFVWGVGIRLSSCISLASCAICASIEWRVNGRVGYGPVLLLLGAKHLTHDRGLMPAVKFLRPHRAR